MDHALDDFTTWLSMLERVVENSTNMVVIADRDRRIMWVNKTYTQITGWTLAECAGRSAGDFLHGPLTSQVAINRLRHQLREGKSVFDLELINYRKSGDSYTVSLNIEPIRDEAGDVIAYLSIQSDISEKKRLETESAQLRRHLEVAQRLARLGRIEYNPASGLSRWSSVVYQVLGLEVTSEHRDVYDFLRHVKEEDRSQLEQQIAQCLESGEGLDLELRVVDSSGAIHWVRCRANPEFQDGRYQFPHTWSIQDVTVYKELIEERQEKNLQLNRLVHERTRRLEEANHALEAFSYALSHDLKKPIRHMVSYAHLLKEGLGNGDISVCEAYSEKIIQAGVKMQALVESMLGFARLGQAGLNLKDVDLAVLIRDVIGELSRDPEASAVEWVISDALPTVEADPILLREVWINLIDNALKYSKHQNVSRVEVGASQHKSGWVIFVRDNGRGFDASHADQIFGMFQRLISEDVVPGSGIGLALVKRIVESHNGRVWAESELGSGATFYVYLPNTESYHDGDFELQLRACGLGPREPGSEGWNLSRDTFFGSLSSGD